MGHSASKSPPSPATELLGEGHRWPIEPHSQKAEAKPGFEATDDRGRGMPSLQRLDIAIIAEQLIARTDLDGVKFEINAIIERGSTEAVIHGP